MGLLKKETFMFNRQTMITIITTLVVVFAVAGLTQTTNIASAHFGDHTEAEHNYPGFTHNIQKWGVTFTLTCTSFIPNAPEHVWWAKPIPAKACFPLGPSEVALPNGCLKVTVCLGAGECSGTICPPDDNVAGGSSGNNYG